MNRSRVFRTSRRLHLILAIGSLFCIPLAAYGQQLDQAEAQRQQRLFDSIQWQRGPAVAKLGAMAEIQVPEGYMFTGREGAALWMEMVRNPMNPKDVGILIPDGGDFYLAFSYDDIGYVPEDERTSLDANAILKGIQTATEASNVERRGRGWSEMHVLGWLHPPAYDQSSHRLGWAIRGESDGQPVANYDTRLLGRGGVMSVMLVTSPEQVDILVPTVNGLLSGFAFTPGNKYAEWRRGEKVAAYGLTGLITGTAVAASAKTGLLGKLAAMLAKGGKFVVVAIAAMLAAIWKAISGTAKKEQTP